MRFSLTTMIVTISLSCLVMGNIISAGKWYYETRALKRELAIAERTTGYLVVDDPTKIQVTNVGTAVKGLWHFRFYLPEGRSYRLCHRVGEIPRDGRPKRDARIFVEELGPGYVNVSFWLERQGQTEWRVYRRGSWGRGGFSTMLDTTSNHFTTLEWFDAHRISFTSNVYYFHQQQDGKEGDVRYFLVENQGVHDTSMLGHRSCDPDQSLDLIKIRATEIPAPVSEAINTYPFRTDPKPLEENNEIPEISDGIQLWIEPVSHGNQ
ncbi:hypothetical protein [Bremerella sp. P1]|uniref:hypothetical protein n=1 Tax=Bremerella sp. P1 TaxID=3026424 RepID=UPI002368655D|nr:hypothetical protein [Bremerella sp. P1]WDI40185.1 hypothetical protein PSR63_17025 [Bremerella sp. P1]